MGQLQLVQNPEVRKWDEFTIKIDFILLWSGLGLLFILSGLLLRWDGSGIGLLFLSNKDFQFAMINSAQTKT